ncbi:hypothetical protein L6452_19670 [Arctium lappa]|uniref:Uncharacterized protein n=1 Tax=Arctium lappa TaxID=4217 RepID=A0ACB9BAH6_ARCLA|nr:hypothetical protein L6452_19670 [Arctium lappa]
MKYHQFNPFRKQLAKEAKGRREKFKTSYSILRSYPVYWWLQTMVLVAADDGVGGRRWCWWLPTMVLVVLVVLVAVDLLVAADLLRGF